jgi:hypothetical protein
MLGFFQVLAMVLATVLATVPALAVLGMFEPLRFKAGT